MSKLLNGIPILCHKNYTHTHTHFVTKAKIGRQWKVGDRMNEMQPRVVMKYSAKGGPVGGTVGKQEVGRAEGKVK